MITLPPAIDSSRYNKHVAVKHKVNAHGWNMAVPTLLTSIMTDAWIFAAGYSFLRYAVAASFLHSNIESIAAFISEHRRPGIQDEAAVMPDGLTHACDGASIEEFMASDRRRVECEALGIFETSLIKSLRSDLILASSVVC